MNSWLEQTSSHHWRGRRQGGHFGPALGFCFAAAIGAAVAYLTPNPLLTSASILALLLLMKLLWRPGEPPVLLFVAWFQWMQITTRVFNADLRGIGVLDLSPSPSAETAIWLSLTGLVALAVGMKLGVRRLAPVSHVLIDEQLGMYSVDRIFILYLVTASLAAIEPYVAGRVTALAQLLSILASVKWLFYILLAYVTLRRRSKLAYFLIATGLEILAGIGFFSEFKTVFFIVGLVLISLHVRIRIRTIVVATIVGAIALVAGLTWMSIREEYRNFLNQGTGKQEVLVSPIEQVTAFGDLVSSVDRESLTGSVDMMIRRLAYVDYFAAVLDYVPREHPHENGGLLWRTLRHILLPRMLYPDKAALESDSDIAMRYTGLTLPSTAQGTSISLGYMAETYIDFGAYGMFIPIFIFGFMWGRMYSWLVSRGGYGPAGLALGTVLLISASEFEIAETKLVGGMLSRFIIFALILRYAVPYFRAWMTTNRNRGKGSSSPERVGTGGLLAAGQRNN